MRSLRSISLLLTLLYGVASCAHAQPAADHGGGVMGPASLALVPADTPYALVLLEPIDEALADRFMGMAAQSFDKSQATLVAAIGNRETATVPQRLLLAFFEEMRGNMSVAKMEKLGFNPMARGVLYGLSIYPVARVSVRDVTTVRATIARVIERAQVQLPEQHLGDQAYWRFDDGDTSYVLAVVGKELVFGVFAAPAVADALPYMFGQKKPVKSLKDVTTLDEIVGAHHLDRHMVGYIDLVGLATLRMGEQTGPVPLPTTGKFAKLSPSCKKDTHRLVALAPRLTIGYDMLDAHQVSMKLTFETPAEISEELAALIHPVPGLSLSPPGQPLVAVGAGVSVGAAIALARRVALAVIHEPFECPELAELNSAAHEVEQGLAQPLPPYLTSLTGFMVTLDELDLTHQPNKVRGSALFMGSGVGDLARMAFSAFGAGAGALAADGRPVALPLAKLGVPGVEQAYVGLKGERAAIAVGAGASQRVVALLGAEAPAQAPLLFFGMDIGRLGKSVPSFAAEMSKGSMVGNMGMYGFAGYSLEADAKEGLTLHFAMQLH